MSVNAKVLPLRRLLLQRLPLGHPVAAGSAALQTLAAASVGSYQGAYTWRGRRVRLRLPLL